MPDAEMEFINENLRLSIAERDRRVLELETEIRKRRVANNDTIDVLVKRVGELEARLAHEWQQTLDIAGANDRIMRARQVLENCTLSAQGVPPDPYGGIRRALDILEGK